MAKITYKAVYEVYVLGIDKPFIFNSEEEFRRSVSYSEPKEQKAAITINDLGHEIYTTAFTIKKFEFQHIQ